MRKALFPIVLFLLILLSACTQDLLLPDLTGKNPEEIQTILETLNLEADIQFEEDQSITHNTFIRYEIGFSAGKKVSAGDIITVYVADNGTILPDLAGKTEAQAKVILDALNFSYDFKYENNFTKNDYDFSRYLGYAAGDLVPNAVVLSVYITWNGSLLPELTDKLKSEVIAALEYDFIYNYAFEYIENDEFEEDMFAGYKDFEAGDPAIETGTIIVYLYKNSFTDDTVGLFISKYLSGVGNNRAIEIYNPTTSAINLDDYHLALFMNGSYTLTHKIQLAGLLSPGGTYVVAFRGSSEAVLAAADQQSSLLTFDGNDVVQLRYKNNTYIDTVYDLGNLLFVMWNEMFIRNEAVTAGSRAFILSQWDAYIPSFVAPLGTHPYAKPTTIQIDLSYLNNTWGSATASGMVLTSVTSIADGDTARFAPSGAFDASNSVRFLGVDTPETFPVVDPWGLEAKAYTVSILSQPGAVIYIQSDPFLGSTETYGRFLGYIWVNGSLLNLDIIRNGFSYNYLSTNTKLVYQNRYLYRWFQDAEVYAREHQLGIHSS
jgi:endonuclease YncB( thermonuclease family)